MKILVYDTECNSLDTLGGYVQELAWAIFNVFSYEDADSRVQNFRCIKARSSLVRWGSPYPVEKEAFAVTGLSSDFCEDNGEDCHTLFNEFINDCETVDYMCGHNVEGYDKPMILSNVTRACAYTRDNVGYGIINHKPHIDTLLDCPYPSTQKIHALKYLALDHGYILSGAHEAMNDVFACAHILSQYPITKVIEISKTPLVTITTKIPWGNADLRERVKNSRFYWDSSRKLWHKKIREFYLPEIQLSLGTEAQLEITRG